jgi:IS30 family transposase
MDVFHAEAEGSAKNGNGLMRQYFPANRFLAFLSGVPKLDRPAAQSNPRMTLGWVLR